jgi:hypothetical protein
MAHGSVDDGLGYLWTRVNFTNTLKTGVSLDANKQSVLGTSGFVSHLRQPQYLSNDALNFHLVDAFPLFVSGYL